MVNITKESKYLCQLNGELAEVEWTGRKASRVISGRTLKSYEMKPVGDTIGTRCWVKETDVYVVED